MAISPPNMEIAQLSEEEVLARRRAVSIKLFGTFELLEAILFELPTRELLNAQKINKQVKATIEASTKLQQALFLRSIPGNHIPFSTTQQYHAIKNPLLKPIITALREIEEPFGQVNVIDRLFGEDGYESDEVRYSCTNLHPSWKVRHASWLNMFPTQPPMESFLYVHTINDHEEPDPGFEDEDDYDSEGPETIEHARCSNLKLTISEMILGLHVLTKKIWKPGVVTSMNESEPFHGAEKLESNHQLHDLIGLRAQGKVLRDVPLRSPQGVICDEDWVEFDSDYESDDEYGQLLTSGRRLSGSQDMVEDEDEDEDGEWETEAEYGDGESEYQSEFDDDDD